MTTLLDTGPLIAAIDRSDTHHARCAALLEERPLLIPTTVIVEVCRLVEERPDIEAAFLESITAGEFEHAPITAADLVRMAEHRASRAVACCARATRPPGRLGRSLSSYRPVMTWVTGCRP